MEWNYVKFLVDREGLPVQRYKPAFDPLDFEGDVRALPLSRAAKHPLSPIWLPRSLLPSHTQLCDCV